MRQPASIRAAKNVALRILTRRNHTRHELIRKLKIRGFDSDTIDHVVADCEKLHYLNDDDFAHSYRKHMTQKGYGAGHIKAAMKQKGFSAQQIEAAFSEYDMMADEISTAIIVLTKKSTRLSHISDNVKKKEQLFRFLYYRGFSRATIFEAYHQFTTQT